MTLPISLSCAEIVATAGELRTSAQILYRATVPAVPTHTAEVEALWQEHLATADRLAQELSRLLAARGAYALTRVHFGAAFPVDRDWLVAAPPELAATLPPQAYVLSAACFD